MHEIGANELLVCIWGKAAPKCCEIAPFVHATFIKTTNRMDGEWQQKQPRRRRRRRNKSQGGRGGAAGDTTGGGTTGTTGTTGTAATTTDDPASAPLAPAALDAVEAKVLAYAESLRATAFYAHLRRNISEWLAPDHAAAASASASASAPASAPAPAPAPAASAAPASRSAAASSSSAAPPTSSLSEVVAYGLGKPSVSFAAQLQLAALYLLSRGEAATGATAAVAAGALTPPPPELPPQRPKRGCVCFDPAFDASDRALLRRLGISVIDRNEECRRSVGGGANDATLFYMVHCSKGMYSNVLSANWHASRLGRVAIVGNGFASCYGTTRRRVAAALTDFDCVQRVTEHVREVPLAGTTSSRAKQKGQGRHGLPYSLVDAGMIYTAFNDTCFISVPLTAMGTMVAAGQFDASNVTEVRPTEPDEIVMGDLGLGLHRHAAAVDNNNGGDDGAQKKRDDPPINSSPSRRHVVVAGGGAIGSATAYYLVTEHNVRVTLIDPCATPAGNQPFHPPAASGHAGGFLATWSGDSLTLHGFALHAELGALFKDTEYRRLDTLSVGVGAPTTPQDLQSHGSANSNNNNSNNNDDKSGEPPSSKRRRGNGNGNGNGSGARAKSNLLRTANVTSCKTIGSARDSTAQVTPEKFVMALQREALRVTSTSNATTPLLQIVRGSVVGVGFDDREGTVSSATVLCKGDRIQHLACSAVVAAMGPWTGRAKAWGGAFDQIPAQIQGLKAHSIVVKSEGASPVALFFNYHEDDGIDKEIEFYPRPNGTTYWCGEADDWHAPVTEEPGCVKPDPDAIAKLLRRGSELSPAFLAAAPERVAACHLPVVCTTGGSSSHAIVGELRDGSGAFVATGHSCWGILQAPSTGSALADLIATGQSRTIDLSEYRP